MELEIKDLDLLFETLDKFHDTFVSIEERLNMFDTSLFSIAQSLSNFNNNFSEISDALITIKEVMLGKFSESELHYEVEHLCDRLKEILDEEK